MPDLYSWDCRCTNPVPPCGSILTQGCPDSATWFWVLAAIAGAMLIARKTS